MKIVEQTLVFLMFFFLSDALYADMHHKLNSSHDVSVAYQDGRVFDLHVHLLHLTEIFLLPGDSIKSIQGGDSASWIISVSREHPGRFFLKAQNKEADSNLLIEGRYHDYWLHVLVDTVGSEAVPYRLKWVYTHAGRRHLIKKVATKSMRYVSWPTQALYARGNYQLIPRWYFTDKHFSYFHWGDQFALPVVYASLFEGGPFHIVNYRMRKHTFIALEKAPYWRLVSGREQCVALSTHKDLIIRKVSPWHHSHCLEGLS